MLKSSLMMIKVFSLVVFALDIDNDVAFLQDSRISRSSDGCIFKGWSQA